MTCPVCGSSNIYTKAADLCVCNVCGHEWEADPKGYKTFILDDPTGFEVLK